MKTKLIRMLEAAREQGYGIGSFSPRNTSLIQPVMEAAAATSSPVIVQISANEFGWFQVTPREFALRYRELAGSYPVPMVLHLDHTRDLDTIKAAIDAGFESVMIDASQRSFEDNAAITAEVVEYAHRKGVCVEAELGKIGATDKLETGDDSELYTDPAEAEAFVRRTGVDTLAISIGTAHGVYPVKDPSIDFHRLAEIRARLDIPLVLHGGSGLPDQTIHRAIREGISKINIATDLEQAFLPAIGEAERLLNAQVAELPPDRLAKGAAAVRAVVEAKIRGFVNSEGKAAEIAALLARPT